MAVAMGTSSSPSTRRAPISLMRASAPATWRSPTTRRSRTSSGRSPAPTGRSCSYLSHVDPRRASDAYTRHYLATDGQLYWSDLHQMADYHDGYHRALDARLGATSPGSEMITELYVPRRDLPAFMAEVAQRLPNAPDAGDLRHGAADRAGRRDGPRLGAGAVGLHRLQPARRPHARGDRTRRRCLPAPDRPRAGLRRQLTT